MKFAKIFRSGNSQAVRIPKEFHLNCDEVKIRKSGAGLVLRPKRTSWLALEQSLEKFSDDFMKDRRKQPPLKKRKRAF